MEMTDRERIAMINALAKFREAAREIGELWEGDASGITPFDDILGQYYPFKNAFFETYHDIENWTNNAIRKLINEQ